ncbi:MAG: hypothetical protein ACOVNV_10630, partial [Pirellulaceae bacterium]
AKRWRVIQIILPRRSTIWRRWQPQALGKIASAVLFLFVATAAKRWRVMQVLYREDPPSGDGGNRKRWGRLLLESSSSS